MKIAIYSANFGNYRNEINNIYNKKLIFNKNIDYYFFTDIKQKKPSKWKVILTELKDKLPFIDKYRHTAKYIKWVVPEILNDYDIIIWVDTKSIYYANIRINKIINLINSNENNIHFIKHRNRTQPIDELNRTVKKKKENKNSANKFKKLINIKFKSLLPDTMCMIYNNNEKNKNILKEVYNLLIQHRLTRDQNIVQYAFFKLNSEVNLKFLNVINFKKNIKNIRRDIRLQQRQLKKKKEKHLKQINTNKSGQIKDMSNKSK